MVIMSPEVPQTFLAVCPVECQVTPSEKPQQVPFLGMDRSYKLHFAFTDTGNTEVLSDHAFWIMALP